MDDCKTGVASSFRWTSTLAALALLGGAAGCERALSTEPVDAGADGSASCFGVVDDDCFDGACDPRCPTLAASCPCPGLVCSYGLASCVCLADGTGFCGGDAPDMSFYSCNTKQRDGDETDVDCGGRTCPACAFAKECSFGRDCVSGACESQGGVLRCAPGPTCANRTRDGDESDVDCGGRICGPCAAGATCASFSDCDTARCEGGRCTTSLFRPAIVVLEDAAIATPVVADWNGDGLSDVAYGGGAVVGSSLGVLLASGNGRFGPARASGGGYLPYPRAAADFDGDGRVDVLVATRANRRDMVGASRVLFGTGDGGFARGLDVTPTLRVMVLDVDGKSGPDVIALSTLTITTLRNDGTGKFPVGTSTNTSIDIGQIVSGDVNGDRKVDLVVRSGGTYQVFLGSGDGRWSAGPDTAFVGAPDSVKGLVAGDWNGDGFLDLADTVSNGNSHGLLIYAGNGRGDFTLVAQHGLEPAEAALLAADFDGDGDTDLVVPTSSFTLMRNEGGRFVREYDYPGAAYGELLVGDFNGDKKPDLLQTEGGPKHRLLVYLNGR